MSEQVEINAAVRQDVGKGASRRLRRHSNQVPAIIYGGESEPVNLKVDGHELERLMLNEAFFSQILNVQIEGNPEQAVLRDLQRNPASNKVVHIDFMRVSANRAIQVNVPIHFVDEDRCVGVRLGGGSIAHVMNEIEITCLPANLPEFIEVYMAELDLNQTVHLSDLALPEGVSVVALTHNDDRAIVSVTPPRVGDAEEEDEVSDEAGTGQPEEEGGSED